MEQGTFGGAVGVIDRDPMASLADEAGDCSLVQGLPGNGGGM